MNRSGGSLGADQRGASELVGVILLFGMVLAGVAIVVLAGGSLLDSLQSEAEFQQVEITSDVVADRLGTVTNDPDSVHSLPTDTSGQYVVSDDGTVTLAWHNRSDPGNNWQSLENVSEEVSLGTIELQHQDVAVAHQGGGVWRISDSGTTMSSPPRVGFDNESVELNFMQMDTDEFNRQDPTAAYNESGSIDALDDLGADPHRDRPHLAVRVESEYSDGWEQAFEQAFGVEEERVSIEEDDGVVVANIKNVHDGLDAGPIIINEDRGIEDTNKNVVSPLPPGHGDAPSEISPDATLENIGNDTEDADVNFTVLGHEDELSETHNLNLAEGETNQTDGGDLKIPPGQLPGPLEPGNVYEYQLTIVNDSTAENPTLYDDLEQPGQFFYLYEDVHYDVNNVDADLDDGDIDLSASVQNLGAKDGTEENVTIDVSHTKVDEGTTISTKTDIDSAEARSVTWELEESEWLNGEYEFNVYTENDSDGKTGTFEVEDGIEAVVVAEDNGIPDSQQIPGTEGQVVDQDDEITINATILNTHDEDKTDHEVTVDILDPQGDENTTSVDIDSFEAKQVSLDLNVGDLNDGDIYDYNITTEEDGLDNLGSFLLREPVPELQVTDVAVENDPVKPFEKVNVSATFENDANVDGSQFVWLEDFDGEVVGVHNMTDIGKREGGLTTTLEWGNVSVVDEQGTVTVQTPFDSQEATVDIEPRLEIESVETIEETIGEGESATIEVTVESLGGDADQTVTLNSQDGEEMADYDFQGDSGTFTLETDDMDRTEYVTVGTEAGDESMRTAVVVERDGPACGEVSYTVNADGEYEIGNIDQLQCIDSPSTNVGLDDDYVLIDDIPAHGTEYWNPEATDGEWHSEDVSAGNGQFTRGDRIELSETPVIAGSVDVDAGFFNNDPEFTLVNAEEGIVEITEDPGFGDDWEELTFTYQKATEFGGEAQGFDPIGSEGHDSITIPRDDPWNTFKGDFNGNGNSIEGLHINRPNEDYVGLFGATSYPYQNKDVGEGSRIENIILEDIHVVGNMYVGGLAGQAGGEVINARAEGYVEADKQLVGGLIGLGAHADIDNRIVADVEVVGGNVPAHLTGVQRGNAKGIGGLIGRAAWETEIAVGYSQGDVTGPVNVGGIMGSSSLVDSQFESMYSTATVEANNHDADAGSIVGIVQSSGDVFERSLYYDDTVDIDTDAWGETETEYWNVNINSVQTDWNEETNQSMTGLNTPENMTNLDFGEDGPWVALPEDYPRFEWELEAEGFFGVDIIDTDEDNRAGEVIDVEVNVTSFFEDRNEEPVTQQISLEDPDGNTVDSEPVTLDSTLGEDESDTITLRWDTSASDEGNVEITVRSEDEQDTENINIEPADVAPGQSPPGEIGPGSEDNEDFEGLQPGDATTALDFNISVDIGVDSIELF